MAVVAVTPVIDFRQGPQERKLVRSRSPNRSAKRRIRTRAQRSMTAHLSRTPAHACMAYGTFISSPETVEIGRLVFYRSIFFTCILNNVFRPQQTLKKTRIKLCDTLALPVLLYGSETWTIKARDARRITAAEMKYRRRTAGYIWIDYKTNTQIAKELKITPILDKLLEYKRNWTQHVNRMPRNRLPRVMKHYSPTGRRNHGRPFKTLLDT